MSESEVFDLYSNVSSLYWVFILGSKGHSEPLNGSYSVYTEVFPEFLNLKFTVDCQKWIFTILGCLLVGLSGIFPLLIFPPPSSGENPEEKTKLPYFQPMGKDGLNSRQLKYLLNFAVGSLLGDVFLHLLPEAWASARASGSGVHDTLHYLGFWILAGIISFVICEKLLTYASEREELKTDPTNNNLHKSTTEETQQKNHVAGYLNLIANGFDNFTHGLAVAGSFIISPRIGLLTTGAILLHEIPHEIGDFAILLRSGFNPWSAAKAQLSTATIGLLGAILTLSVDCMKTMGDFTWWILPYTSGGFINIALTNLLPELLDEENPWESAKQLISLLSGIGVMALVSLLHEVQ